MLPRWGGSFPGPPRSLSGPFAGNSVSRPLSPVLCALVTDLSFVLMSLSCRVARGWVWVHTGAAGETRLQHGCALRAPDALPGPLSVQHPTSPRSRSGLQAGSAPCARRTCSCPMHVTVWSGNRMCVCGEGRGKERTQHGRGAALQAGRVSRLALAQGSAGRFCAGSQSPCFRGESSPSCSPNVQRPQDKCHFAPGTK